MSSWLGGEGGRPGLPRLASGVTPSTPLFSVRPEWLSVAHTQSKGSWLYISKGEY